MRDVFYVYMMASRNRRALYIGITNSLRTRVWQHRQQDGTAFSARYHCIDLVYYEPFPTASDAIAREKQLKGWRREKKDRLVEASNPRWEDLSAQLLDEMPMMDVPLEPGRDGIGRRSILRK